MGASKDQENKIDVLEAMHYTVSAWRQVTQHTLEYCFRKAGYGRGQPSDVSDVAMRNEDDDDAFRDWQKFSGMDNETFDNYISVESYLATSGVNTVKELCESHVGIMSVEGEEEGEDSEPKVVPNFAEAQEVLVKVKSFVYAHSNSNGDRDSVLSLESSFFKLRRRVSTKQLNYSFFFTRTSSFNEALYHVIANKQKSLTFFLIYSF
jgi:hypothetical protein